MKKHLLFIITILLICIVLFCACSATGQYFLFGTFIDLNIEGSGSIKTEKEIASELERLEELFSATIEGSDVWRINYAKANEAVTVSGDTMAALAICKNIYELSGGAFDPTVYPLVMLWKFTADTYTGLPSAPPSVEAINELLSYVGFNDMIMLDETENTVTKSYDEVQIDFGGVAKGYAAKKSADIAQGKTALLNLGGNIVCVGKSYKIGVANPRESDAAYFGSMTVENGFSVSTSGDYERYYEYEDVRYHHIINPKTGYPSGINSSTGGMNEDRLVSVTVISEQFADCDAIATAALILGKENGVALLQSLGLKAVLIDCELNYLLVGNVDFVKK